MAGQQLRALIQHLRHSVCPHGEDALSDAQLLERWTRWRDEAAFELLLWRHGPMVLSVCRRLLRNSHDIDDAFQAAFLTLVSKSASIRRPHALAAWLYRVAYRIALRLRRDAAERARREGSGIEALTDAEVDAQDENDLRAVLDEAIDALPERCRQAFVLCCFEGKTHAEAARLLGRPVGTISCWLKRGRERLREGLMRRGIAPGVAIAALAESEAQAVLPGALVQSTVRAAIIFTAGGEGTAAVISARVVVLVDAAVRGMAATKLHGTLVLGLMLSVAAAGAGMWVYQPLGEQDAKAQASEQPGEQEGQSVRTDRYGDPLPPGALRRFGTLRMRHAGEVRQVVFSPDGKMLASAGHDPTGRLWDAATGKELHRLTGSTDWVSSVAFSPDGRLVASGSHGSHGTPNHSVFLWDAATGKQLRRLDGHKNEVQIVLFSPDGKLLASAGYGKSIRLWDVATGNERNCLVTKPGIYSLAFSPDGQLLASSAGSGANPGPVGVEAVLLWDVARGVELRRLPGRKAVGSALAFSPDGKTLAVGANNGTIRLCDVGTGKERRLIQVGQQRVSSLAFLHEGKTLLSGGFEGEINLWDAVTGKKLPLFADRLEGECAVSADKKRLAMWCGSAIRLWDMTKRKEIISLPGHWSSVRAAAITDRGETLISSEASAAPGFALCFWELVTGKQIRRTVGLPEHGRIMTFAPDAATLAAAGEHLADASVRLWDVKSGKRLHTLLHDVGGGNEGVTAIVFAADGRTLATATGNGMGDEKAHYRIHLWDPSAGRELRRWPAHKSTINEMGFTPDGRLLVSASWDQTLCLWSTATGKQIHCLKGHTEGVRTVAVSPDGRLLASAGQDGTLRLWESLTGGEIHRMKTWATRLAFAPDGQTLASVNGFRWNNVEPDNVIRVWDVATGTATGQFAGHPDGVTLLRFSSDGNVLVSGGDDSTLLAWDVANCRKQRIVPSIRLASSEFETYWRNLEDKHAVVAHKAITKLTAASNQAVEFLRQRLTQRDLASQKRIAAWINQLDDDRFSVREKATTELAKLGDRAEPALRHALANRPSLEVRRRVESILEKLEGLPNSPDALRQTRAIAVLEKIGTMEAQQLLKSLAHGEPVDRITREAKASLERRAARRRAEKR